MTIRADEIGKVICMPYSEVALLPSELERKRIVKKLTCCVACREQFAGRDPELFVLWETGDGAHHAGLACGACAAAITAGLT